MTSVSRLGQALNIDDLRTLAHQRVPGFALAYLEGGADDRATLQRNRRIFEILIGSGVRHGTDIAKALALGASAVMAGRTLLYGAAAAARPGIDKVLGILAAELERRHLRCDTYAAN